MTGGYTRTANYTLFRADEGKVEVEPIEQAICKGIESLADYVHEDPAVRAIKYLSGRSAGVVTWSVTPKKDGKEVEVRIDIEEKPLPRTRW
jgi:glycyl-tRNA synthetase alpha subunit